MNKIALSSENLTKVYSKSNKLKQEVLALKNLSLEVKQGRDFWTFRSKWCWKNYIYKYFSWNSNEIIRQSNCMGI